MLKIYVLDGSWAGGSVFVAESKEEALEHFKKDYCWEIGRRERTIDDIEEHEIVAGLSIEFMGDR